MKVLFLCLGNEFTPSMLYKENYFIKAALERGDEALVVATPKEYKDGESMCIEPGITETEGYRIIRIKNKIIINQFISDKLRVTPNLKDIVFDFAPDLLFFNCPQIYNVNDLPEIKGRLPHVKIIWDFSTGYNNSGKTWLSLNILHKGIYRRWLKKNEQYVDKIFYVAEESRKFIREVYHLPESKMEYNDLPGKVIEKDLRELIRQEFRKQNHLDQSNIVFMHSGKMGRGKKTLELLDAFRACSDERFRLFIIGSFNDEIKSEALERIAADNRVQYLGFVAGDELTRLLCACDMYLQPGTMSQTLQTAICCGCAVMCTDCPNNRKIFARNGFLLSEAKDIKQVFISIAEHPDMLSKMSDKSLEIARNKLDYRRLYEQMWK